MMQQELNDFRKKILKVNKSRKQIINGSLGVFDAYRWISKNKWLNIGQSITTKQFYKIVRSINNSLVDRFLAGHDLVFPYNMGKLVLVKAKPTVKYEDGKLVNKHWIDWNRTLSLWNEDEDSFNNKTIVRTIEKNIFKIHYSKKYCNYKNQKFFKFRPMRSFKLRLKDKIENNEIDALMVWQDM